MFSCSVLPLSEYHPAIRKTDRDVHSDVQSTDRDMHSIGAKLISNQPFQDNTEIAPEPRRALLYTAGNSSTNRPLSSTPATEM